MSLTTAHSYTHTHTHTSTDGDQYIFIKCTCHCKFLEYIEWAEHFSSSSIFMVMEIERVKGGFKYIHTHTLIETLY